MPRDDEVTFQIQKRTHHGVHGGKTFLLQKAQSCAKEKILKAFLHVLSGFALAFLRLLRALRGSRFCGKILHEPRDDFVPLSVFLLPVQAHAGIPRAVVALQ